MRFLALVFTVIPLYVSAQTSLPNCPQSGIKHECFGSLEFPNGSKYIGEIRNDKANGNGIVTFPSGSKYVGQFSDNKFYGQGTYSFANGDKHVGQFSDNKLHGQGTIFGGGGKIVGEFKNGKLNGRGYIVMPRNSKCSNCQFHVERFIDNVPDGEGIKYQGDGRVELSGRFKGDILISSYYINPDAFPFDKQEQLTEEKRKDSLAQLFKSKRNNLDLIAQVLNYTLFGVDEGSKFEYWAKNEEASCVYNTVQDPAIPFNRGPLRININDLDPKSIRFRNTIQQNVPSMFNMNPATHLLITETYANDTKLWSAPSELDISRLTNGWQKVFQTECKGKVRAF